MDSVSDNRIKLVLASASPRRLALLEQGGFSPDLLCPIDLDETRKRRETPRALSARLALEKAHAAIAAPIVKALGPQRFIIAADTLVAVGRRILAKPGSVDEAAASLELLSGRSHKVITTVAVVNPADHIRSRVVETKVRFKRLSREDIDSYLVSDEWRGKAGSYAIQGRAEAFVRHLNGSHSAVVGLPLYETVSLLAGAGYPVYYSWMNTPPE
jgi:nucleoside triphosphate pyrophosphatase